ncbi:hypothetical protein [Moraxella lacunata]
MPKKHNKKALNKPKQPQQLDLKHKARFSPCFFMMKIYNKT